ncbi:YfhO family protein [Lactiplantibacillus dongliensis]|uniref:YfhO family protein n=1 Tax=Lactiplantibacillus dongliensis TaxID=2559919 RepID=A0ABW1R873_9LACO|nr:YfhO family protein [Lactiplantibacillus dongliensis]
MQHIKTTWHGPLIAGSLALLVISTVLWHQQITPFGNHNLLISDMGTQYLSFFTAYRYALLHQNFQLYSFSQSLGGSVVPTLAYYLMSPFNLIILLFPAANLPTGITVLLMAKVAAIAITMTIYLQRHYHSQRWSAAIFGVAFSLCGFVALNYFNLMWFDALIWLPLVLDGLDYLLATGRSARFFWWLWLSIVTDFYLGYMTCLFVVYYFIYMWFETKAPGQAFSADFKQRRTLVGKAILTGILSVVTTLFLLIPTVFGMLQTAKSANSMTNFLPVPQYGLDILSQLGVGANTYADRLVHAPTLFSTTAVVLLALAYFVHPDISQAHKWHAGSLVIALLLSMGIRLLDTVWHMFQQPEGFPFRDAFFFSFVLISLAFATWQARPQKIARKWQWGLPTLLAGLLVIGWLANRAAKTPVSRNALLLSFGYVLLTSLVLFATQRTVRTVLLTGLMMSEMGANSLLSMRTTQFGNQTIYQKAYKTEDKQMSAVNDPDGQLYRVDNSNTLINKAYQEKYNNYNDPLLFNFHDINYYSSTLNQTTWQTLKSLGLFGKNARRISSQGLTPVSGMLLGIKNDIMLQRDGQAQTTPNLSYLGMGFAVNHGFSKIQLMKTHALANQENSLQSLRPSSTPYFVTATIASDQVTIDRQALMYHNLHTTTIKIKATGPLYYDDISGTTKYTTFRVNGQLIAPNVDANEHQMLLDLGNFNKGQTVKLTFKTKHQSLTPKVVLASLNLTQFQQVSQQLKTSAWVPTYRATGFNTTVTGTMYNPNMQNWLYTAIPYDPAWTATVNGQPTTTKKALNGLTLVHIGNGKQTISLHYQVSGLKLGATLSLLSLITYLAYGWYCQKQHLV